MIYIILLSAVTFALSFIFNDFLFRSFELSQHVSLVFIPSGVRIFFALVFGLPGALGIGLGSLLVSLLYLNGINFDLALSSALVAAGAAWAARWLSIKLLRLEIDLGRISLLEVTQVCFIFAAISAVSHQALFFATGMAQEFALLSLSMFAGDVTGALACLLVARYTILLIRRLRY
jgi:hypothetical protein